MSNSALRHPEGDALLRYIDGELPARKARQVRRHLEACWQCRTEVEELQGTVADCVRYRKSVLATLLPPPPNPWPDLARDFARIDASLARGSFWNRLPLPQAARPWTIAAMAALAVAGVVLYQLQQTPSVQAATLLKKAVAAAAADPHPVQRIQIRTRSQRITRTIAKKGAAPSSVQASAAPAIQALFQAAHYDWNDPLSARSYEEWRDGLAEKKDEVSAVPDPRAPQESCYRIRTVTADGELAAASLTLRSADLHPTESRLEFRDDEFVEISEITDASTQDDEAISVVNHVEHSLRPAEPSRPAATLPRSSAPISDELQVLSALHRIGADLGDPVEVRLSDGRVLVTGVGVPAGRQKQIRENLSGLANVTVEFSDPAAAPEVAVPEPGVAAEAPSPAKPPERLEKLMGGPAEFDSFSTQILQWDEAVMSHAHALRSLAQHVPAESEAELNAADRQLLHDMARAHADVMASQMANMQRVLAPVLRSLGGSAGEAAGTAAMEPWQTAAEELFRASRRVEVQVSVLLGVAPGDNASPDLPSQLLSAIRELRADLDHCHLLLARQ